ncbi:hypothetical protein Taro_051934 [Colocasia esculenta]|uniref:t-SNARE coiled-coil homology domain-containing protein n=1 Tax=Colocasia esculenta TaxID=4460 RepID=A0A843XI58_COLES|nr:hypothetical protein [Colocasia esculenta]
MNNLLTDSFVASGNQSSEEDDIELGKRVKMSAIDLGMDDFFKQDAKEESRSATKASTMKGTRPDEEVIDRLIETGNSEQIFQKAIQEMGRGQVHYRRIIDALEEIQERRNKPGLIQSISQVFMDMAVLVETQGEILDNIECQVGSCALHLSVFLTS